MAGWEKPVVSTASSSSRGLGPGRSSPCPCPNYTWPHWISLENLGEIPLPQMVTICCCLSKARRAVWGVGREVTPKTGPCPRQGTQHLRDNRATGTQQKIFLFLLMYTHMFPAKSWVSEDLGYMGFGGFTLHCKKEVLGPHDGEHLTLITCRHHTGCCFHFLSSWYFWRTWEAGSLHSCKHRFKKQRSPLPFTYQYFLASAMRISY